MAAKISKKNKKESNEEAVEAKVLEALTVYYAVGSLSKAGKLVGVPKPTLHIWIKRHPKLAEEAKKLAREVRLVKAVEVIDKFEFQINAKLDIKKNKIPFKELLVGYGIFADKYMKLAGIAEKREIEGKIIHDVNVKVFERYIQLKEQAKKELEGDSSNRIKKHLN